MARALDIVGDRWTILILRELLGGPARFQDLYEGLPGIAKNLLTERLRRLEGDGIIERVRSHGVVLYALTEQGETARTVLEELAFWGAKLQPIAAPEHPRSVRAIAMALHALLARSGDRFPDGRQVVELDVDGDHMQIVLGPNPSAHVGSSTEADARVRVPRSVLATFLNGLSPEESQFVLTEGAEETRIALLEALGL